MSDTDILVEKIKEVKEDTKEIKDLLTALTSVVTKNGNRVTSLEVNIAWVIRVLITLGVASAGAGTARLTGVWG